MDSLIRIKTNIKLKKVLGDNLIYFLPLNYYVGGTSCLDFIDSPNNLNIIVVYRKDPINAMNAEIVESISKIAKENKIDLVLVPEDEPSLYDWLYAPYYINIFGLDSYKLNLLNEPNKIINLVKAHYNKYKNNKARMFEIVYYYFIVNNNKLELYPYQKQILAKWHKGIYDEELLNTVVNELRLEEE